MALGEVFLGSFICSILKALISPDMVKFLREEGFEKKINKWGRTLEMIIALLQDAEEKQLTDKAVRLWLDDLEELAYDAEDMLDEFEYEATARKMEMDRLQSSKFLKHVPTGLCSWTLDAIRFRTHMWYKVDRVTSRFNQLCELRGKLGLREITGGGSSSTLNASPLRPPTSSLPTGAVYGRDEDKRIILKMVKKSEPNDPNVQVIPIVGMGGVGKTTLAREIYNHPDLISSFDVKAWVCVSDGAFDVARVSMSILMDITGSSSDQKDFNIVHNELKQKISGKRFLLVLDDVWNISYDKWEILKSPFIESSSGSKIIVTTRDKHVASTFTLDVFHALDILPDDDCWSVFSMCLSERSEAVSVHPRFKSMQENVTKKCKGLPLTAKALGGILRSEQIDDWLNILNSGLWTTLETEANQIPTALKLSYHHLPSHLRRCFSYCAIFPKDHEFEIEKIVRLWIAEGFIQPSIGNEQLEETGYKYFRDLEGRSMFQQSSRDDDGTFVMHDLVHDLAEWAIGKRYLRLDCESAIDRQLRELEKVRHFSYTPMWYDRDERLEIFQKTEGLKERVRTFLPLPPSYRKNYIATSIPYDLLPELKRVRVLSLEYYTFRRSTVSLGRLKHLRYLNFCRTNIESLPASISILYNLQFLILSYCRALQKLPSNLKYLFKLRHLDIEGSILIEEMPLGMKDMRNLQNLSHFIVGKDGKGSDLKELMELKMLHGKLCIERLEHVIACDDNVLILKDKEGLEELSLVWGFTSEKLIDENVLVALQPHENLQKLTIRGYGGTKFPSWVGTDSYSNMKVLKLINCRCESLPSLGALSSLEELEILGMGALKRIGVEFYGKGQSIAFKSLKSLCFQHLPVWTDWESVEGNEYIEAFPCLQVLSVVECPQLSGRLPQHLLALEDLTIRSCRQLVVSFSHIPPKLSKVVIDRCKRIECDHPAEYKSIRYLELSDTFGEPAVEQVKHEGPQKPVMRLLHSLRFLTELLISKVANMVSFPEVCSLPLLSKLEISRCKDLISLPDEMTTMNACLEAIFIFECDSLEFVVNGQLPPSLKTLSIHSCKKLERLWDDRRGSNTNSSLLDFLSVEGCPSLTCLSSIVQLPPSLKTLDFRECRQLTKLTQSGELPASLKYLHFYACPQLTTIAERFPESNTSIEVMKIWNCKRLLQIPHGLHNLRHLRELNIEDCRSIEYFPMEGLANTDLRKCVIRNCQKLKTLPTGLQGLNSLEEFEISRCSSVSPFNPEQVIPTNIKSLSIEHCENVYRALVDWGLQNFNSLTSLKISTFADLEFSFPQPPSSLINLFISHSPKLRKLKGLQKVSSLKSLTLESCLDLNSLGDEGLPSSLYILRIWNCPKLVEECERNGGTEWPKICNIPRVYVNEKHIFIIEDDDGEAKSSSWFRHALL